MKRNCPKKTCNSNQNLSQESNAILIVKCGFFKRSGDSKKIQRFKCKACGKCFSSATFSENYRQVKRRINKRVYQDLTSGKTQRRTAIDVGVSRGTVARRLISMAKQARIDNIRFQEKLTKLGLKSGKVQIDDLITKENSKLKPLSISIAADAKHRFIIGAETSIIPSFGHIAAKSRTKYGPRPSEHMGGVERLFEQIKVYQPEVTEFISDKHKSYPIVIQKFYKSSVHHTHKSERAHVAGQGEMKKVSFDPLFTINHVCAMFRADICRLTRKVWTTTKKVERLQDHVQLYIKRYNDMLLFNIMKKI